MVWAPVSGNAELWLKVAGSQALVEWQVWHTLLATGMWPAGFVWQPLQVVGSPALAPRLWHDVQLSAVWAPVSLNA